MALGSTQPPTETSTSNILVGKWRPARKADLTVIYEPTVKKMWEPRRLTTLWVSTACYRDTFTLLTYSFLNSEMFTNIQVGGTPGFPAPLFGDQTLYSVQQFNKTNHFFLVFIYSHSNLKFRLPKREKYKLIFNF
jgi:hypothetical protein